MNYLKTMLLAFNEAGKSKAQVAREAGMNDLTFRHYMRGDYAVPAHRRAKLCQVLGVQISWDEYQLELDAAKAERAAAKPAPAKLLPAGVAVRPATTPPKPMQPRAVAPTAAPKRVALPPAHLPPKAPPAPSVRRFFGIPIIDDTAEASA